MLNGRRMSSHSTLLGRPSTSASTACIQESTPWLHSGVCVDNPSDPFDVDMVKTSGHLQKVIQWLLFMTGKTSVLHSLRSSGPADLPNQGGPWYLEPESVNNGYLGPSGKVCCSHATT